MAHKVFIASSTKNHHWALALQSALVDRMDEDLYEFVVWDQEVFSPSSSTIHDLINTTFRSSAAIFLFAGDDEVEINGEKKQITRDNVIFEFGLFAGYLGLDRTLVVSPKNTENFRLLSDINGITTIRFSFREHSDGNKKAPIAPIANQIQSHLERVLRADNSITLSTLQSIGITNATFETDHSSFSYAEAIKSSNTRFMLLGVGADKLTINKDLFMRMVRRIMENGGSIRLLLLDPESYAMSKASEHQDGSLDPFQSNVKNSLMRIAEIIDLLDCRRYIQIRSYFVINHDYAPPFRLTFIDDEKCIVSPRSLTDTDKAKQQPQLIYRRSTTHEGPGYYGAFKRYFESIWRHSTLETVESMLRKIETFPKRTALIGCVHGRFQPPHKGHQHYILSAKSKCDFLYIGITQPDNETLSDSPVDPHRAEIQNNPLSFNQRAEAIRRMLAESGLFERKHFLLIPYDIDRPDMLRRYISTTWVQYTTLIDKWNIEKNRRLQRLGYETQSLAKEREDPRITGTEIRRLARAGDKSYSDMITVEVSRYLDEIRFTDHLKKI